MSPPEAIESSLENAGGLTRRLRVTLPAALVSREVEQRLRATARNVSLKGYRPGKVPMQVLQARFGEQVRREVIDHLVRSSVSDAIAREKLRPVGQARIDTPEDAEGPDLTFCATFEILPQIDLTGLDGITVDKPEPAIDAADIEYALERLRHQQASWRPTQRAARIADRVIVNSAGLVDGRPVEGVSGQGVELVLGQGQFLAAVERELVGMHAGEERSFDVAIPADFGYADVAGHTVNLTVELLEVHEPLLPEVNADFARQLGVPSGDMTELRSQVARQIAAEFAQLARAEINRQLFRSLVDSNPIPVPTVLVEQEARNLQAVSMRTLGILDPAEARAVETFRDLAEERIRVQMLIEAIAAQHEVRADPARLQQRLAGYYGVAPERLPDVDPQVAAQLERDLLEEQVGEWLEERSRCTPRPTTYRALIGTA